MPYQPIAKPAGDWKVVPNLTDYEAERTRDFWERARRELDGLPGGAGLNIAYEAVDRHAAGSRRDRFALRWLGKSGEIRDFTYGDLAALTNRFANVSRRAGPRTGRPERTTGVQTRARATTRPGSGAWC